MKKILVACIILVFLGGCVTIPEDPTDNGSVTPTNDTSVIEDWYDADLTPGDDGSGLTQ